MALISLRISKLVRFDKIRPPTPQQLFESIIISIGRAPTRVRAKPSTVVVAASAPNAIIFYGK
jgi:hypothetical protein